MEKWDAYDNKLNKLNFDLTRGENIPTDVFHLVSEVIIINQDGSFLAMKRDNNKASYPGLYEVSAGGSVLKDENPTDAAKRETLEETGVRITNLEKRNIYISEAYNTIFISFITYVDIPKDSIILQEGETINYKWITNEEIYSFLISDACVPGRSQRTISDLFGRP